MNRFVEKDWGWELWFENNDLYCGKLLKCNDMWSSKGRFHYHRIKDETFFIVKGRLILEIKKSIVNSMLLTEGVSHRIFPGDYHRFRAYGDECQFVEVSTHHDDKDTYYDEDTIIG